MKSGTHSTGRLPTLFPENLFSPHLYPIALKLPSQLRTTVPPSMHLLLLLLLYLVDIPTFDQAIIINNKRFHELVSLSVFALQIVAFLHFLKNKASLLNYMHIPPLTLPLLSLPSDRKSVV